MGRRCDWNRRTKRCAEVQRLTQELEIKNRELARKNRLADLGQMASHIAHEVRNSLVPVTLYLSLLRRRLADDTGSRDLVEKIAAGFTALDATVNDLLQFTADRDPRWQLLDVRELVEDVLGASRRNLPPRRLPPSWTFLWVNEFQPTGT